MALSLSEDELIERYFAPLAGAEGLGLRDDAALLAPTPGSELVVTVDAIVAGVHFFADDPPDSIARKALRVNLSDLAAKGATPRGFLLSLALPAMTTAGGLPRWLEAFAAGLGQDARQFACPLLGGDTVATPGPLSLSITALGEVPAGKMVRRTGARPGDWLYVSGAIGDGALGLRVRKGEAPQLSAKQRDFLLDRYRVPQPRNALAATMAAFASGGMDVSDGLVGDLGKMLRASGVTGTVDLRLTPFSSAAAAFLASDAKAFTDAVTGGDDYELLAAVPPDNAAGFAAAAKLAKTPVTKIGMVEAGDTPAKFIGMDGSLASFARGSYSHF